MHLDVEIGLIAFDKLNPYFMKNCKISITIVVSTNK
jgi:hypothetical protein